MIRKKTKKVCGWGVVDVNYYVCLYDGNIGAKIQVWKCPYYTDWVNMINRCYNKGFLEKQPTYKDCTICDEWKYLSNFIKWVDSQPNRDWIDCALDKDILFTGNKQYGPINCAYITKGLNQFLTSRSNNRGTLMIGVQNYRSKIMKFKATCHNPFNKRQEILGCFATELEAHKAWQAKKHEHACQIADLQDDIRVADALRQRYAPDKDWTKE